MKNKKGTILIALAIIGILIFLLLNKKQTATPISVQSTEMLNTNAAMIAEPVIPATETNSPPIPQKIDIQAELNKQKQAMTNEVLQWRTPLLYYGMVVDESNQPISGVQVSYGGNSVNESLTEATRNEGVVTTDERGIFKIDGLYGIGLMFQLSHPNYYPYPDNSTGFDVRSRPRDGVVEDSEAHARIFRMHSKGHPVPLIFRSGGFHAPNDGSIASFPLRGNTHAEILGQLQVQGWNNLRSDTNSYDWKVQITIPEGGMVESTNYFEFLAPEEGYSDSDTLEVSGSESVRKTYFLKLPAGYILFKLNVIMGKDMFVTGDYDFNPDGSRNLEPSQEIRPTQ